jgi:hypothetical protein
MSDLLDQVSRFRQWAAAHAVRYGERECEYDAWPSLYGAVTAFLDDPRRAAEWSPAEWDALLYAVARDNETQLLARTLRERGFDLLLFAAQAARHAGEPDAKWQLAAELGHCPPLTAVAEELLLAFANDPAEYVRRRALQSLARLASPHTERIAITEWARPDDAQQWARMNALHALHLIDSPALPPLLAEAELDPRKHLSDFAKHMRAAATPT